MTNEPKEEIKPKKTKKTSGEDYILSLIDKINEDITVIKQDIKEIDSNANHACQRIEELSPKLDKLAERLGL